MQQTVPSQIVEYLRNSFSGPDSLQHGETYQRVGALKGLLDLYAQMPSQLIQLQPDRYAALVSAIGTIEVALDQYRHNTHPDCLRPIPHALSTAWKIIETLPDQVPAVPQDLSFIQDPDLRDMIALDISAIGIDLQSGEWKGATILAGSCCEALLLYGLQTIENKRPGTVANALKAIGLKNSPNASDLTDRSWDLHSYGAVAHHIKLVSDNTKSELDPARDYRNLIHPAKAVREKIACDRGTAFVGAGAIEHVLRDLKKNL